MRQFTDVILEFDVDGDTTGLSGFHMTFTQGGIVIDVTDVTVDGTTVTVPLTQAQTGRFSDDKPVDAQLNYFNLAGMRDASDVAKIDVWSNLLKRVISQGA